MRLFRDLDRLWRSLPPLSLRVRLILRLAGLLLLVLLVGGAAIASLLRADQRMRALVADSLSPVSDVGRIQNNYSDSLNALTHAGLTRLPSAVEEAKTLIQSNRVDIERRWRELQVSGLGREQAQLLALADTHRKAAEQVMNEAIGQLDAEQYDLAQLQIASDVQPSFAPLHADFANLFAKALQAGDDAAAAEHAASRRTLAYLLVLLVGGLLVIGVVDGLLIRSLSRSLRRAVAVTQRIANGELGRAFEVGYADEIGALLHALQQMDQRLCVVVSEVQRGAEGVRRAADQLAHGNDTLKQRTEAQVINLERTTTSMAQMTHAVRRSADHALLADRLAAAAREQAEQGCGIVVETAQSVDAIGEAGRRMADIVSAIDTLAFQTRLLALNAAVEAAHAGTHGRGFAVVADEVRELAQRSAEAAREIRGLIDDSRAKVEAGALLADRSGYVLEQIVDAATKVSRAIADISASSRGQSAGIGEIGQSMRQMDETTRQNEALVAEAAEAGRALREQADVLLRQVGFFDLSVEAAA